MPTIKKIEEYITEHEFSEIKNKLLEVSIKIKGFMDYLRTTELKGSKFKKQ